MTQEKTETEVMREHIVWLSGELIRARDQIIQRNEIMRELLDPEMYGWTVPQEIRGRIYNLFSHEREAEIDSYNRK